MPHKPFELSEVWDAKPRQRSLFGCRVRDARKRAGMSQAKLAEDLGLERTTITQIETGRSLPSLPRLLQMCVALHVTPNDLIWERSANRED